MNVEDDFILLNSEHFKKTHSSEHFRRNKSPGIPLSNPILEV